MFLKVPGQTSLIPIPGIAPGLGGWRRPGAFSRMVVVPAVVPRPGRWGSRRGMGDTLSPDLQSQLNAILAGAVAQENTAAGTYYASPQYLAQEAAAIAASCAAYPDPSVVPGCNGMTNTEQLATEFGQVNRVDVGPISQYAGPATPFNAPMSALLPGGAYYGMTQQPGANAPRPALVSGGALAPAVNVPASVLIENVSRPGYQFQVGDLWRLTIRGAPNQPVTNTASLNGASLGTTNYGVTGADGSLVLNGNFPASTAGTWSELWTVSGASAPALTFTVSAATGVGPAGSASAPLLQNMAAAASSAGSDVSSVLGSSFQVAGYQIPLWAGLAGGFGLLWLLGGRR